MMLGGGCSYTNDPLIGSSKPDMHAEFIAGVLRLLPFLQSYGFFKDFKLRGGQISKHV